MWETRREDGFVIIHAMIDDWRGTGSATQTFREEWVSEFGLTFPVLGEGDINDGLNGLGSTGLYEGGIPFMILVDKEMRIDSAYTGSGREDSIMAKVDILLEE